MGQSKGPRPTAESLVVVIVLLMIRNTRSSISLQTRVHGEFVIMPPWASEIIRDNVLSIDMTSTSRTH